MAKTKKIVRTAATANHDYERILAEVVNLLDQARRTSARSVNAVMTATYWAIGQKTVEHEQSGQKRAVYGSALLKRLSADLTVRYGRGFSVRNLEQMRVFYLTWQISQTPSAKSRQLPSPGGRTNSQTPSAILAPPDTVQPPRFPLPWSHYVRLLSVRNENARTFYEREALSGGWSFRQLDRQIDSQFYERAALSRNKVAMLTKGAVPKHEDATTPEEEIKDPYILEFLGLKDEYSESALEAALIAKLETFLLELGGDFTFVGRQRRLRVGDHWYRVDLMLFHRRLRCLVVIDLKVGEFTHADAGQMHLYLNYAREHWTLPGENPPVGLILCAAKDAELAHYSLGGLPNKVLAAEYRTTLPDEKILVDELRRTRRMLTERRGTRRRAVPARLRPRSRAVPNSKPGGP
ncbi:MAG: DUF1016 domain-containing protein [Candidatus Wallbacteria bacterium]|nr:DUF1016 domain-containing protein [Candidatus Wallbacteria bacterium]